ncbi:hypothetical protein [Pseudomonas monteilii]|uniref:hypothetical protein n=1 Tax=Pseudomonas monteilii TaxID=76759 RepID=UPI0034E2BD39
MANQVRIWQWISIALAVALIVALLELNRFREAKYPIAATLPIVKNTQDFERLAMPPNARRVHERYSL